MTSFKAEIEQSVKTHKLAGLTDIQVFHKLVAEFPKRRPRRIWREFRGLTGWEVAERCSDLGVPADARKVSFWENYPVSNDKSLDLRSLLALSSVLEAPLHLLVDELDLGALSPIERDHIKLRLAAEVQVLKPNDRQEYHRQGFSQVATAAAARSVEHSNLVAERETKTVDTNHFLEKAKILAQDHLHINSLELFRDTFSLREEIYSSLELATSHSDKNDLYLLASLLSCLLADTCISAGTYSQAQEIARAAYRYADVAGHSELKYWSKAKLEGIAFRHQGDFQSAIGCARTCDTLAKSPILKIQHHNTLASYYAFAGQQDSADFHLEQVSIARQKLTHGGFLAQEVGGMFAYPIEKENEVRSGTLLKLKQYAKAESAAQAAIERYAEKSATDRAFGNESLARINIANSRILSTANFEGAIEILEPVFSLPGEKRQTWFATPLIELASKAQRQHKRNPRMNQLCDMIEEFAQEGSSDHRDRLTLVG